MLVTETWEAMEYMSIEPPTKILLAAFMGYKSSRTSNKSPGNNPSESEVAATLGKLSSGKQQAPAWVKGAPSLQKLFADMRKEKGQPNAQ
jgi:hypothetical protein